MSKTFAGVKALDEVGLSVRPGCVHAIVGPNGSGKSTFVKIVTGVYDPDPHAGSSLAVWGKDVTLPVDRAQLASYGVCVVQQDTVLIPELTVAENVGILMGFDRGRLSRKISWRHQARDVNRHLDSLGIPARAETRVLDMSPAERKMVEIAAAVPDLDRRRLIIFDEASAVLPVAEVGKLHDLVRQLRDRGSAVLYVTHRMAEVFNLSDYVSVFRDGHIVATKPTRELDRDSLFDLMFTTVGRPGPPGSFRQAATAPGGLGPSRARRRSGGDTIILEVSGLSGTEARDFGIAVRSAEVVGLFGDVGSGANEIVQMLSGLAPRRSGKVALRSEPMSTVGLRRALGNEIAFVSGDRKGHGAVGVWSIEKNLWLGHERGLRPVKARRETRQLALEVIDRYQVNHSDPTVALQDLSGGTQQKVIIARALEFEPAVCLLMEPTQGVDVATRERIYERIRDNADRLGTAFVIASSDEDEIVRVCDRAIVMVDGEARKEVSIEGWTGEELAAEALRCSMPMDGPALA